MSYRKISANYIFTLSGKPLKNGIVVTGEEGTVVDVIDTGGELVETGGLEHYSGILCPGFINAHCHLELSHLKWKIAEQLSLPGFLHQIFLLRNCDEEFQEIASKHADRFMWKNGIVAVGDIAKSSINLSVIEKINPENKLLLVHNTFLESEDLKFIIQNRSPQNTFLVTCPTANLYIENRLPHYKLLNDSGFPVCIGTDSLASNHTLSILEEMKVIGENFPEISMNKLLEWACINGAMALGIDEWAGSIEIGKKPGINLISGVNLRNIKLTLSSKIKKLL